MLATMAWVSGSDEVLEDGTMIPNLTGAADITAMQARLKSENAYHGVDLRILPWLLYYVLPGG
jgi:hypothetical protein